MNLTANYLVQPYPVEFTDQPNDLVFFNGSTISLYCETNCVQLVSLKNTSCAVGFLHDGVHLDYEFYIPYDHTLSPSNWIGRRKVTIFNTNDSVVGKYQCITDSSELHSLFTDIVIGKPVHVQMAVLEPIGGEVQVVNVPEGESVELSCMRGIYPSPDNISWWRNDINCDSLQCLDNIWISPSSGSLLLSNVTANISGNVFECEIGWKDHDKIYNVTYQIFVNDSETEIGNNSTFTEDMIMIVPSIVTLNTIVDGITEGHNYKEDLLLDISQVSNNYKVNVTITCSFTGHPRPQVNWLLNGDDIYSCDINVTIVTEGNTSTLHLMMFDPQPYMGSYQCVVVNKAGYVSKTTRILPRGWTNPPAISSSPITTNTDGNIVISLTWGPPEYTGGESVQNYKVTYTDFENNDSRVLTRSTTDTSLQFGEFKFVRGKLFAQFAISLVDSHGNEMSDSSRITVDSRSSSLQPEISNVDCTEEIATIDWINHYHDDLNTIWGYCVHHYCNTVDDVIINETCVPELRNGYFGPKQQLSIPDLPLKGNCSFRVSVLLDGTDYKWSNNNNNKTCSRKLAVPVIVVDVKDQTQVEGYSVNFTCQATGEPVPTISWYFNDVPVNMSTDDKHNISTMSVNETSINSRLIVKSVKSSDVGTYTCKATNILSTDNSSGVLSVNVSPNITEPVEEALTIIEGGNITCRATGYPVPDVVWLYINGSEVDKKRLVTSSVMATGVGNVSVVNVSMIEVMRGDSGVYTCLATNPVGDDNTTVSVYVQFPSAIVVDVKDQTQVEGYSVNFTCQATGEPVPTISWYFNDVPVNMSTDDKHNISTMSVNETSINSRLIVKSVKSSDVGTYTCKATNILSTDNSSGVLSVNVSPNITVPVEGETLTIIEGGNITCTATGYPVPDIVWLDINGSEVDKARLVTSSVMATGVGNVSVVSVSMIEVMRGDSEDYTCLATNPVGDDNTTVNVNVQFPSAIVVDVKDQTQVEGYSVNFTCQATGEPVPTISWYFNDVPVNMSTDDKHNISTMSVNETSINSRLIVKSVKSSDVGTYTCKATNILSTDNSSGVLSVNVPSAIVVDVKDQTQVEGSSVNFTCQATGEPVPTISWYFNDVPVNMSTDDKHNISTMSVNETSINSRLIVKSVKSSDVGTYTCKATNILSTDNSSGVLSVNVSPNVTEPVEEALTIIEGGNITCRATGYPVPDIVWLDINGSEVDKKRLVTSSVMATGVGNVLIVSVSMIEVMRGDGGVYTCLATNPVGDDNTTVNVSVQVTSVAGERQSDVTIWIGIFFSILLISLVLCLLMTSVVLWRRRMKTKEMSKVKANTMSVLKEDIADFPYKDTVSTVETLSTVSDIESDDVSSFYDYDPEDICKKITHRKISFQCSEFEQTSLFSFRDSEVGDTDMFDSNCTSQCHYYVSKQTSNTTTTGDSGIDSIEKFSV
ncbi:hemicentin-1-like isoform X3 [Dysidea avara]|uniref:hemicentin-1-like isoform X3 n=1 Tax=Dysidea avara TaxID=196820 RepID=UPI00333053CC